MCQNGLHLKVAPAAGLLVLFLVLAPATPVASAAPLPSTALLASRVDVDRLGPAPQAGLAASSCWMALDDRKACSDYYPLPAGYQTWTNCSNVGSTACGGPAQCSCQRSERMISYTCDQGTYNHCEYDDFCAKSQ